MSKYINATITASEEDYEKILEILSNAEEEGELKDGFNIGLVMPSYEKKKGVSEGMNDE